MFNWIFWRLQLLVVFSFWKVSRMLAPAGFFLEADATIAHSG